jgi:hypothetical protein
MIEMELKHCSKGVQMFRQVNEEERLEQWLRTRARGKARYIWRAGIFGWGLFCWALWVAFEMLGATRPASTLEFCALIFASLVGWLAAGYTVGSILWAMHEKKYWG